MPKRIPSLQERARLQSDLYRDTCRNMAWEKYCAATSAFYSTSPLVRPCHSYPDQGRGEDAFHMDLAIKRGVVFA